MESVTEFESLSKKHLLPGCCLRKESFIRHIVDVLDGNDLFPDVVEIMDEGTVTGRTEKERVGLCPERLVFHIHSHSVGSLVLECESDVVCHAIFSLVCILDFFISLLEKMLVLRRDGHNKICSTVLVPHVVLRLYKMLCKCSTDLTVSIFMELQDTLRFRAVAKSFVCKGLGKHILAILRASACLLTEKFRSVECKFGDSVNELSRRSIVSKFLTLLQGIKSAEKVLEHTRSRT